MRTQISIVCLALMVLPSFAQEFERAESSANLVQTLLDQGIARGQFLAPDREGMPRICGSSFEPVQPVLSNTASSGNGLPPETRAWECIPGVIRTDGVETFRLEVDVNGDVARVMIDNVGGSLIPPEPPPIELFDDGLGEDRVAGDGIYTAGPYRYSIAWGQHAFYLGDASSPSGMYIANAGRVTIEELDGTTTRFMRGPQVGTLATDIPAAAHQTLAPDVVVTPHLINIRGNARVAQRNLRFLDGDIFSLTKRIYLFIPDAIDFFMFFSSDKVERLPRTA